MHFAAYDPISANIILSDENDSRIQCDHYASNCKTPIMTISNELRILRNGVYEAGYDSKHDVP